MKAPQTASGRTARRAVPPKQKIAARPVAQPKKEVPKQPSAPRPYAIPPKPAPEPGPETAPRRWPYIALLVAGVLVLGMSAAMAWGGTLAGWERNVFVHINGAWLPNWVTNDIAKPISNAVWGIIGLLVLFLFVPKYRLLAWQYLVAGGSAYVLAAVIEHVVGRARPVGLTHDVILRAAQDGAGFPSGHVSTLAAICGTLWLFVSWPWRILLLLFVAAEAWSRLYLGVHAPLDVIGAVGVACIVLGTLHLLPERIRAFFRLHR